ncbi:hypothetical protein FG99_28005 [Pseudomonas sp. AAC]|nr:hypothetical protein FG99_28005 [Pseudomonas sp. AAC]
MLPGSVGRITVRGYTPIVGAGPARESRAGRAPTGEWRSRGCVADLIRESRRWFRPSRTRSYGARTHGFS